MSDQRSAETIRAWDRHVAGAEQQVEQWRQPRGTRGTNVARSSQLAPSGAGDATPGESSEKAAALQPTAASAIRFTGEQVNAVPFARTGEALEIVPGLIVTQHSGEGKANQYFLRGFNLDHGTDLAISVDGMPVNMPTHGHGQGYADINFVIPETIERYRTL